jgi:hypothetical protein
MRLLTTRKRVFAERDDWRNRYGKSGARALKQATSVAAKTNDKTIPQG